MNSPVKNLAHRLMGGAREAAPDTLAALASSDPAGHLQAQADAEAEAEAQAQARAAAESKAALDLVNAETALEMLIDKANADPVMTGRAFITCGDTAEVIRDKLRAVILRDGYA